MENEGKEASVQTLYEKARRYDQLMELVQQQEETNNEKTNCE